MVWLHVVSWPASHSGVQVGVLTFAFSIVFGWRTEVTLIFEYIPAALTIEASRHGCLYAISGCGVIDGIRRLNKMIRSYCIQAKSKAMGIM
jgi:hypothetical protein